MATDPDDLTRIPPPSGAAFAPRVGNHIEPLVDGAVAFDRIAAAVEAATTSVRVCVAFLETDARFPGGRGTFFDLMDAAASRGVDVRVLFWHPEGDWDADDTFGGTESSIGMLGSRSTRWQARWDAVGRQCQHQKAWLVDAGTDAEVAFVGGINIGKSSMAGPDHAEPDPGPEVVGDDSYADVHDVHCLVRDRRRPTCTTTS